MIKSRSKSKSSTSKKSKAQGPRTAGAVDAEIGARIRAHRVKLGVSQQQLAADLGLTFQQVQKYEKGVNRVAASTLLRIARVLGCRVTELLPDDGV